MKRPLIVVLMMIATLALAPAAFADIGWQTWSTSMLYPGPPVTNPTAGITTPFWNNGSYGDGSGKNIGYCLTVGAPGSGDNCTINDPQLDASPLEYWGDGNASAAFAMVGGGSPYAALKIEIAGNHAINEFGWYGIDNSDDDVIFSGGATKDSPAIIFTPTANIWGFYLEGATQTFKTGTDSGRNFALFRDVENGQYVYWLGMEDLPFAGTDRDYNDMVVKITPTDINITNVPDGGMTLMLLGGALFGLETLRRRFAA